MSEPGPRITQLLSSVAIVLSLVFVGVEIRQNTAATRGATMQAMADANADAFEAKALDADFAAVAARVMAGATRDDLSAAEDLQLVFNVFAFLARLENTYLQHREGLVGDAVFESYGWNDGFIQSAWFREFWEQGGADRVVSPEFKEFFESRVQIGRRDDQELP